MQTNDIYRDSTIASRLIKAIHKRITGKWSIMEICGGQTHAIARYRLEELLPSDIEFIHGPGCPVCVTPESVIDKAVKICKTDGCILASFGDMMRVPGSEGSLLEARSEGGDIRIIYSPLDALRLAEENPHKQVVLLAIGFETTAPLHAVAVNLARNRGVRNFSVLTSLFLVPPAINFLKSSPDNNINGLLAAGHVCAVSGCEEYNEMARTLGIPISVTGFEPNDILYGIYNLIDQLENKEIGVRNSYSRIVREDGNIRARKSMSGVFQKSDCEWRGLGIIPQSGLTLKKEFEQYNATSRFNFDDKQSVVPDICPLGQIMKGKLKPAFCPEFGRKCTPEHPLGAAMVSSEGVCSAFYRYRNYENNLTVSKSKY